ncbi:hypothetical protein OsI_00383 [Oryza sativa Indica Group]|uniref:RHOMBOID-like protein n=1 Tax=Oryza sativa subsp. indica TaxID=39946 RepID=A2WKM6_ORYSI|nr:hypothetical protein OsI_00383 [Oryza sativa Indica Group]
MLSLLLIGIRLEKEFGFMRIGTLYVISGVGGSLLSALFMVSNISVGASGALFGLLGSMLSELITNWTIYENKFAALLTLVIIILINLAVGILPHVDNFAHLGGFTSGFFLGFVLLVRPQFGYINQKNSPLGLPMGTTKSKYKTYQIILWVIATLIIDFWVNFFSISKRAMINIFSRAFEPHAMHIAKLHSWPGFTIGFIYGTERVQCQRALFLVPLPELCTYFKVELQHAKQLLHVLFPFYLGLCPEAILLYNGPVLFATFANIL